MNKTYVLWIVGAIAVVIAGVMLFTQGPAPATNTTPAIPATTGTNNTGSAATQTGGKAIVTTTGFSSVSSTTAVVVGTVVPQGAETSYWFEYGPTPSLGLTTSVVATAGGYNEIGATAYMTGLKPSTSYYFRLGAKNTYGIVYGGLYNFITAAK